MSKSKTKNIKRLRRMKADNMRKTAQRKRIERQIRKAERKDIILSITIIIVIAFLVCLLIYIGSKAIISLF